MSATTIERATTREFAEDGTYVASDGSFWTAVCDDEDGLVFVQTTTLRPQLHQVEERKLAGPRDEWAVTVERTLRRRRQDRALERAGKVTKVAGRRSFTEGDTCDYTASDGSKWEAQPVRGGEAFLLYQLFDYWDYAQRRDRVGTHEHGIQHVASRAALADYVELLVDGALPTDDR